MKGWGKIVGTSITQFLTSVAADSRNVTWSDWLAANKLYVDSHCHVPSFNTPSAFLPVNEAAWIKGLSENQTLVRKELIVRPLTSAGLSLNDLLELHKRAKQGDADARASVESFCETWNQLRDGRPMFAAFYDEVQTEADHDEWFIELRNRLGLGHYGFTSDRPIEIALMRYSLDEVFTINDLIDGTLMERTTFSLPTVLDDGMHAFFFPVPREHPFGATLHLDPDQSDTLTCEVLHRRIDYAPEHISRLGSINQGHELTAETLASARDIHLMALQIACNREDFGELFEGRT